MCKAKIKSHPMFEAEPLLDSGDDLDELFGLLAALFLDDDRPHHHRCPNLECLHVWKHKRSDFGDGDGEFDKAHTCPKCKTGKVSRKCHKDGSPL